MKNKISNIKGFSVAALLVAAGMMGGLAMVLANLTKQQMGIQIKAESAAEINELSQRITYALKNGLACLETINQGPSNRDLSGVSSYGISTVYEIDRTQNPPTTRPFIQAGGIYRNRLIQIGNSGQDAMEMVDVSTSSTTGSMNLKVTFIKNNRAIKAGPFKKVVKKFPLNVELATATNKVVIRCLSHRDSAVAAAKQYVCEEWGGTYTSSTGTCSSAVAKKQCPGPSHPLPNKIQTQQEYFQGFDNKMDPICAPPPSPTPHDLGNNCYLLTTYIATYNQDGTNRGGLHKSMTSSSTVSENAQRAWDIKRRPPGPGELPGTALPEMGESDWKQRFSLRSSLVNKLNCNAPPRLPGFPAPPSPLPNTYTEHFRKVSTERWQSLINAQELMFHYCCR